MIAWLGDPAHWSGSDGVPTLLAQHVVYTAIALAVAVAIGVPIGLYVGHTGRGTVVLAGVANALRALPSLGLIVLLVILVAPLFTSSLAFSVPSMIVLVLLAVPPIVTSTYAGVAAVDPAAVDAARGMGMRPMALLLSVQVPCALPLMLSGVRSAVLQVISTATIAAYVSLGGLGRLIIDGRAQNDYPQMLVGALLVAALALVADLTVVAAARLLVSPGITRRPALLRRAARPVPAPLLRRAR